MTSEFSPDEAEERLGSQIDDPVPGRGFGMVPLVGIGSSATDGKALQQLLAAIPQDCGLSFAVVLHGDSEPKGWREQVGAGLRLKLVSLEQSTRVAPNTVYLAPPRRGVRAMDGALIPTDEEAAHGRMVVDLFLRSLADTHGAHSAAVVLSGTGADGAVGIKRVKERGGLTVAQDPDEAAQDGMPRSAIGTGMVDWVLPVQDIPQRLLSYFQLEPQIRLPSEEGPQLGEAVRPLAEDEAPLRDVLTLLRTRTGRDFTHYKRATILRRIGRRMQVNGVDTLPAYLNCLRTRHGEPAALLQDLLITVTNFFRDANCFAALERQIPALFAGKGPGDTVRVWVVACATGEEAYSLAILLSDYARTLDAPPQVQVFATDLDDDAIAIAREGVYPQTIEADVSEERLKRYFVLEHRGYRVRRELREMVLFAVHDALKDSPFSRLDLVSCRNLLIYLGRDAQMRLFDIFHFALLPDGRLFLGASESVEDGSQHFTVLDKKHRIYAQRSLPRVGLPVPTGPGTLARVLELQQQQNPPPVLPGRVFDSSLQRTQRSLDVSRLASWGELHLRLLEQVAPPSVLVNGEYDIVHLSANAGRFLQFSGGEPTRNLLRAVLPGLRIELRAALYQAGQTHARIEARDVPIETSAGSERVTIRVTPANDIGEDLFLVVFDEAASSPPEPAAPEVARTGPDPVAQHLDRELERLKNHLRDTVEQYEASTEELKASNEELQAMNEELRSATEELETSREELQSINEELTTVNHELKNKVEELGHANSDMHNLMDATAIATVFLDRELRITRYTPSAVTLFNLIPTDIGRPLTDLTTQVQYPQLGADARRVLERLVPVEREVGHSDGHWYLARLLPYRTIEDRIAGVVLSFVDISERKQAEEVRLWLSAVVSSTADAIISFSLDRTILSWNAGAERLFGYSAEETIGKPLQMLAPAAAQEQDRLLEAVAAAQRVENVETVRRRKDGSEVHVALTVSPIRDTAGHVIAGTAIVRDITAARVAADALRSTDEKLRRTMEATQRALREQQLAADEIQLRVERLLQGPLSDGQKEQAEAIRRSTMPLQEGIRKLIQASGG